MNSLKMGQFMPGDSLIHSLDPRTKILCCSLIIFAVLFNYQWPFLILYTILILLALKLANIRLKKIYKSLRKLRYILLFSFVFQALLTTGNPLWHIGSITISKEGIDLGISTVFRLLIIYLSSTLLTITTTPVKISSGLESILLPLRYVKIPVQQLAMIIGISLRFIPTFIQEAEIIKNAQRSRGAPFNSQNIILRFKSLLAILIPLLAASLQRAGEMAIAMESRCYTGAVNYSRMSNLHYKTRDKIVLLIFICTFILALINRFF